jgi:hypothetical protein
VAQIDRVHCQRCREWRADIISSWHVCYSCYAYARAGFARCVEASVAIARLRGGQKKEQVKKKRKKKKSDRDRFEKLCQ